MRYLIGFMFALALAALPQSASAQDTEEGETTEPNLQEPAPSSEPAPEEPALQLKLDDAGVEVAPSPPRTPDGYTLEEMETRVYRAKVGMGISSVPILMGGIVMIVGISGDLSFDLAAPPPTPEEQKQEERMLRAGAVLAVGGAAAMIATGILLGVRKRDRRRLQEAHYGTPHRVQWDLTQSRLVF
jgi:hypothetical protein